MRTRKRIREREEKTKPKKQFIPEPEDFIDEDYQEVKRLMKQAKEIEKKAQLRRASLDEKLSTESDQEHKSHSSPKKSKANQTSSSSEEDDSHSSGGSRHSESSGLEPSEEIKSKKPKSANQESSNLKKEAEKEEKPEFGRKKRELKDQEKIKKGLEEFLHFMSDLSSPEKLGTVLREIAKGERREETKEVPKEAPSLAKNPEENVQKSSDIDAVRISPVQVQQKSVELAQPEDLQEGAQKQSESKATLESAVLVQPKIEADNPPKLEAGEQQPIAQIRLEAGGRAQLGSMKTSTEYPLTTNQCIHARCAYYICYLKRQKFIEEQYAKMQAQEMQLRRGLQQPQVQEEAVRIQESPE